MHLECYSPPGQFQNPEQSAVQRNTIDSPGVARGKVQPAEWRVSLSVHQIVETWLHRNTSSASPKSSVTELVFWGDFFVVFIGLFVCLGYFVCLFISWST